MVTSDAKYTHNKPYAMNYVMVHGKNAMTR